MSKTVSKIAGFVIGAVLIGIGIVTGNVGLIIQGGAMIVTQAIVDLTAPKIPARQASEQVLQLGEQPRVLLIGETFTAGSLVDGFNYGGKYGTDWECLIIRLADHKCDSLTGLYVNDEYNPYTADGLVARYDDQLEIFFRSDTTAQTITSRVTDHGPGWTVDDVGESGCDVVVCYKADKPDAKHPGWPGGRPRFGFVVKGALCYDPRLDDTVTGGSGDHREDDPATWEWSENAAVCRYKWVRGVYANDDVTDQSALLIGRGLTADEAPPENIFAAANLCDEVVASVWPYDEVTSQQSPGESSFYFSPDGALMAYADAGGTHLEWWDVATRSRLGFSPSAGTLVTSVGEIALDVGGTAHFAGIMLPSGDVFLFSCSPLGTPVSILTNAPSAALVALTRVIGARTFSAFATHTGYLEGAVFTADAKSARDFSADDTGAAWALFQPTGSSNQFELRNLDGAESYVITGTATRGAVSGARLCYVTAEAAFKVYSDGYFYTIDKATGSVVASVAVSWTPHFASRVPARNSFWDGLSEYSLANGSLIRTVPISTWASLSVSHHAYDSINNAIWAREAGPTVYTVAVLFLDRHGGYLVAGPIYSNQDFIDVEGMFAAATAGNTITHEGSVELEPGQAKSIVATITDDDLLAGGQVSWNQGFLSESNGEWVNGVVGRYVEPDLQWQDHATPIARDTADIVADGRPREASITMRLVRRLAQAQRIVEINRRLGRLWGRANVKLGPRFCELEEGDWISWQSDRHGFTKTFRIEAYSIDQSWQIALTLREIAASVYADDAVFQVDHSRPTTTPPPPEIGEPDAADWTLAPGTLDSAGASVPILTIDGAVPDDENADVVIVEYWKDDGVGDPTGDADSVAWTMVGTYDPSSTHIQISGLTGGETYFVALTYVVSGIPGDRLVLGPETVADLDVSGQVQPLVDGNAWKAPTRAKTTAALPANSYSNGSSGVGATLTGTSNAALAAQDGVTLSANDRLLVANEAAGARNGIYKLTQVGDGSHPYILTRTTDADSGAELVGATVKVSEGTVHADSEWQCTTNAAIVVGTTALVWAGSALQPANNLSDLANPSTARANLGLLRPVAFFFTTAPAGSEKFGPYPAIDPFTIPANMAGTQVAVGTNPAATFVIDVQRALAASPTSFSSIGTISIATSGAVTLATTGGTAKTIAAGDVIRFVAPSSPDAAIADVGVNVKGAL